MLCKTQKLYHILKDALPPLLFRNWGMGKVVAMTKTFLFLFKNIGSIRIMYRNELFSLSLAEAPTDGMILEFGVGRGTSIREIGKVVPDRIVYGFDSFEGLPEDWVWVGLPRGTHKQSEPPDVPNNVELVVGLFQDTLKNFLRNHTEEAAFIHLDADLYSSTKYTLFTLGKHNRIAPGTVIQFDEYYSVSYSEAWTEGVYTAFHEFVEAFDVEYEFIAIIRGAVSIKVLTTGGDVNE